MNWNEFLYYLKQKKLAAEKNHEKVIRITKMLTFSTYDISNVVLILGEEEIQQSKKSSAKYQKTIPKHFRRGIYADSFGNASAIKRFTSKYGKYSFNRTTTNLLKNELKNTADKNVIL